jgi:hypothetical protein
MKETDSQNVPTNIHNGMVNQCLYYSITLRHTLTKMIIKSSQLALRNVTRTTISGKKYSEWIVKPRYKVGHGRHTG